MTSRYLVRGIGYSFLAFGSLAAGFLMRPNRSSADASLLLVIASLAPTLLALCYAICFHYEDTSDTPSAYRSWSQRDAVIVLLVLLLILVFALVQTFALQTGHRPSAAQWVVLGVHASLFGAYATYLWFSCRTNDSVQMRHQLIWPSVLVVAVNLYTGFYIDQPSLWADAAVPIGLLGLLAATSLTLGTRAFRAVALTAVFLAGVLTSCAQFKVIAVPANLVAAFSTFFFALSIAGYLAAFEAWRITAHAAQRLGLRSGPMLNAAPAVRRYYVATAVALVSALWWMPIFYLFANVGLLFIAAFIACTMAALWCWLLKAFDMATLTHWSWPSIKTVFGFTFLVALVIDAARPTHPATAFLSPDVVKLIAAVAATVFLGLGKRLGSAAEPEQPSEPASRAMRIFAPRMNMLRAVGMACAFTAFCLVLVRSQQQDPTLGAKIDVVLVLYFLTFVLIGLGDGWRWIASRLSPQAVAAVIAVASLCRLPTALAIGTVIYLSLTATNDVVSSVLASVSFGLAAMGGFALNDWCDIEKDRVNRPKRALPSGALHPAMAMTVAVCCLITSVALGVIVCRSRWEALTVLAAVAGVVAYAPFVRRVPTLKGALAACLCSLPTVFVLLRANANSGAWVLAGAGALFIFGRELLMDIRDIGGDSAMALRTVPIVLGVPRTTFLALFVQTVSGIIVVRVAMTLGRPEALAATAACICVVFCAGLWLSTRRMWNAVILGLWGPIALGYVVVIMAVRR